MHTPHSAPRAPIPIGLVIAGALLALIPIGVVLAWLWLQWATLELLYPYVADTLRLSIFLLPIALGTYALTTGIVILWRRHGWKESIFADK